MLKEIFVQNFKCFKEFSLPMTNINVLTGINGVGKSTLIQSILLMRQSVRRFGCMENLLLNGEYISLGSGKDVLYEKASNEEIIFGYKDEKKVRNWTYQYLPESDMLPVLSGAKDVIQDELFGLKFNYLSAFRIIPQKLYSIQNEKELRNKEFGTNGVYALQYLNLYGDEDVKLSPVIIEDKLGKSVKNQVRMWLNKISPGVSPQIIINMQQRTSELYYEFVEGREKTGFYNSVNVGFGITYVLPLILTILFAEKGDIVVIENPEAHIHPAGQRMLGELIARAGASDVQFIIETHSDHIINGLRIAVKKQIIDKDNVNISFFYKDMNDSFLHKCINPKIQDDGRLDCWPEGFFDEWDKALYELI